MGKLDQKVAIITGAARGIGKQIAVTFAREGADIVIGDISEMEVAAQEIRNLGRKVITVKTDVSRKEEVKNLVDTAIDNFKKIDILVNNAGINRRVSLLEMSEEDWDAVLDVNLKGTFLCTQAVAKYMVSQKYGKIINIASTAGLRVVVDRGQANYTSSKAGVIQLTRACAAELGPDGINVNAIAPGVILTDIHYAKKTPAEVEQFFENVKKVTVLGRLGTPQELANVVLFLASDDSSFVTGQVIVADGGQGGFVS